MGTLLSAMPREVGQRLELAHEFAGLVLGESISVGGACLTLVGSTASTFAVDVSPETLHRTTLGEKRVGERLNLERAARVGDRLGGHLVTGHVDGIGTVVSVEPLADMTRVVVDVGTDLGRYAAEKGSITIDGVSLTINGVEGSEVSLLLIPHTRAVTTLGQLVAGARVNVEVDLVARYVERLLTARGGP